MIQSIARALDLLELLKRPQRTFSIAQLSAEMELPPSTVHRLLQTLAEKAIGRRRALEKSRVIVTMSQGATRVEHAALEDVVRGTGAKRCAILRTTPSVFSSTGIPDTKRVLIVSIAFSPAV